MLDYSAMKSDLEWILKCLRQRGRGYCAMTREQARGLMHPRPRPKHDGRKLVCRERRRYWRRMAKRRGWRPGR